MAYLYIYLASSIFCVIGMNIVYKSVYPKQEEDIFDEIYNWARKNRKMVIPAVSLIPVFNTLIVICYTVAGLAIMIKKLMAKFR